MPLRGMRSMRTKRPGDPAVTIAVVDLRVEYQRDCALGIGEITPPAVVGHLSRYRWLVSIRLRDRSRRCRNGAEESGESVLVPWPGPDLIPRVAQGPGAGLGRDGSASDWSEPVVIEAGLLSPGTGGRSGSPPKRRRGEGRPIYFRHAFEVVAAPGVDDRAGAVYATSAGVHQLHLNGEVVGSSMLSPGWSAYASRLRYETHDITGAISQGENVIGAVVADGWWMGNLTWLMRRNVYGEQLGLLVQVEISFSDGTTQVVGTSREWRTSDGPIVPADLYHGETFDARIDRDGWSTPRYDDGGWAHAIAFRPRVGDLVAPTAPPVRCSYGLSSPNLS